MTHIIKNVTNNARFYGRALKTYVSKNKLSIDQIDYNNYKRILNPPTTFINVNDMQNKTINMFGKEVDVKCLETSHGIYLQLQKPVPCGNIELIFGLGCGCIGFDPNKILYYPNYKPIF
jgi:hypothetical protein